MCLFGVCVLKERKKNRKNLDKLGNKHLNACNGKFECTNEVINCVS